MIVKNKKALVFISAGINGGTATLSYRIGEEFIAHDYDVFFVYNLLNNSKNVELFERGSINVVWTQEKDLQNTLRKICNSYNYTKVQIITYAYEFFGMVNEIKEEFNNNYIDCYLYIVNTHSIVKGLSSNGNYIRRFIGMFINKINQSYIQKMYKNKQLIFMDQIVIDVINNNTTFCFPNSSERIFYLPYKAPSSIMIDDNKNNILMTMARIEFPFKGYILGLIDVFSNIAVKYDSELWIIGDGESLPELEKKIDMQLPEVKKRIKLFYNVSYDKIGDIIKQAKVFVGMGTGILDATAKGVPCIAVKEHTYECLGKGLFKDYFQYLGFSIDDNTVYDISDFIKYVFSVDNEIYKDICNQSIVAMRNNYSIERFYERLNGLQNGRERFNWFERVGYIINKKFIKFYSSLRKIF